MTPGKFKVVAYYVDEDGVRHFLNKGTFFSESPQDARECAMQAWWDPRLEAASCSPDFRVHTVDEDDEPAIPG